MCNSADDRPTLPLLYWHALHGTKDNLVIRHMSIFSKLEDRVKKFYEYFLGSLNVPLSFQILLLS
jgi:hypothetical protein